MEGVVERLVIVGGPRREGHPANRVMCAYLSQKARSGCCRVSRKPGRWAAADLMQAGGASKL